MTHKPTRAEVDDAIKLVKSLTRYSIRYFLTKEAYKNRDNKTDEFDEKLDGLVKARNMVIKVLKHAKKA